MRTLNNLQLNVFLIATVLLTMLFTMMILIYGFRQF